MGDEKSTEGLNKIAGCDNKDRTADVVFVHGLGGNAYTTWQADEEKRESFWPQWLGDDEPYIGVWSLGYAANASAWKGHDMPLFYRASNVLERLSLTGLGGRPLIFVCHSLGGLVVKQVLLSAYDSPNPNHKRIAEMTRGIVFLATPHFGSNKADWVQYLKTVLRTTESIKELEADSPNLMQLNERFRNSERTQKINIRVYFETQPVGNLIIVNSTSANPGVAGVSPTATDENHLTICKPKDKNSLVYLGVKQLVEEVAKNPV